MSGGSGGGDGGALDGGVLDGGGVAGLEVRLDGPVLRLTLDRPEKRNALDDVMVAGLVDALDAANRDERVRAVVLRGRGDHFCSGADIVARNTGAGGTGPSGTGAGGTGPSGTGAGGTGPGDAPRPRVGSIQRRTPSLAHRLIPLVASVQVPVVCGVQGWTAGIGLHLAAAADFTVATRSARLWEPFATRGFTPDSGATWLLPRLVGVVRARELLLLGRELDGPTALAWGLVADCVDDERLDEAVEALVARLAAGPTVTLGLTKRLLLDGATTGLADQLHAESLALELSSRSEDFREGLAAFRDKRDPRFTGR